MLAEADGQKPLVAEAIELDWPDGLDSEQGGQTAIERRERCGAVLFGACGAPVPISQIRCNRVGG